MAKTTKKVKKGSVDCPEFNELLRICTVLGKPCESDEPLRCDLRSDVKSKPVVKADEPKKSKKDELPPKPRLFTIEEQLRELGVEPSRMEKQMDKIGIEAEVGEIHIHQPGEIIPQVTRPVEIDLDNVIEERDGIQILEGDMYETCRCCGKRRYWRKKGSQRLVCDWCHPSLITPSRQIYPPLDGSTPPPMEQQYMPKAYNPLDDF